MIGYMYKATIAGQAPEVVATTARGVVEFESAFAVSVTSLSSEMPMMSYHYWMAWRCSGSSEQFDQWIDALVDFEVVTDGNPTGDGGP